MSSLKKHIEEFEKSLEIDKPTRTTDDTGLPSWEKR
jgi:hypothetical protein